ncbi:Membrane associated serine protease, rhomboid family [Chishuiella changwenlii]|jgi:membrane associated rhomboid family serine protease|uniref:Membrane associated serine protease, rhomboid family n=3 Tax=Chishuiella changwenlii TaxID=1434701 RepID=A0A1M6W6Z4_9FLAO|nr:Membrane associated serine protease, rhomboid family [Chishuiella changwenlii]
MIIFNKSIFMNFPFPKKTIIIPLLLLLPMWVIFLFQINGYETNGCYGVIPRTFVGLKGILFSPLFHSGWKHIISNSIPLAFLSFLALLMYGRLAYYVIFFGWIISGMILWLIGNPPFLDEIASCHIGASSIVYLLASFIFFSGIIRKERGLMAISLVIILLYGGMIWGMVPQEILPQLKSDVGNNPISWEGHLSGFITGVFFAYLFRRIGPQKEQPKWEQENYYDPREEQLWQMYQEHEQLKNEYIESLENNHNIEDKDSSHS